MIPTPTLTRENLPNHLKCQVAVPMVPMGKWWPCGPTAGQNPGGPLRTGRLGCPACGEGHAAENKVEGHGDQQCWKLCCVFTAHSAMFAVFNHTRPHAPRETTTEASVFRKNSRVGAHVGWEPACRGSGSEPVTLAFCLCSMFPGPHLGLIVVLTAWGDREG